MEKTVSAYEARRNLGRYLQEVSAKGEKIVVERHGEPIAVVVPVEVYRQWQRSRQGFFDKLQEMADRADLSPEEADRLAEEAVKWARNKDA